MMALGRFEHAHLKRHMIFERSVMN